MPKVRKEIPELEKLVQTGRKKTNSILLICGIQRAILQSN